MMDYRIIETTDGKFIPQVLIDGNWQGIQYSKLFNMLMLWQSEQNINSFCQVRFKISALSAIKGHKNQTAVSIRRIIEIE